jgi:hypothetical protein
MQGIATKFQNVPLRDANVFEQLPRGMRSAFRLQATLFGGKSGKRSFPVEVGVVPQQKLAEMFANNCFVHGHLIDSPRFLS